MSTPSAVEVGRDDVKLFDLPLMEGMVVTDSGTVSNASMPTARSLEALHREAYEEGLELGRKAGIEQGKSEINEKAERLAELLRGLAEPFNELDDQVVSSVADLSILIAKLVIRRELKVDPGEIVAVVRDTMQHLPVAVRSPRVRMHPDDIEIVASALSIGDESRGWELQPDPLITRGGCVVETESSRIDATVEARLAAIIAKMFGGEREGDRVD